MHVQSNEQERAFGRGLRSPRCCLFVVIYFYLGKTFSKSAAVLAMQYGQVGSPTKSLIVRSALNTAPQSRQRTSSPTFHLRGRACAFSQLTFSSVFIVNSSIVFGHRNSTRSLSRGWGVGGGAPRPPPPTPRPRNPLNLTRATVALAFYRRYPLADFRESFDRANIPAFRGKPAHDFPCPQPPRLSHRKAYSREERPSR